MLTYLQGLMGNFDKCLVTFKTILIKECQCVCGNGTVLLKIYDFFKFYKLQNSKQI